MAHVLYPSSPSSPWSEKPRNIKRRFHIKVQASLDDPRPNIPHDHMRADMEAIIRAAEQEPFAR
ncbi:antitoxin PaaA2 family protein [Paraburkholderia strydomiana]|uniref:antitoxin PaaA2 family protein n=1 Tax=Paraburkholderia strydomiana TaxID=1245417 RepID=UPI0038B92F44